MAKKKQEVEQEEIEQEEVEKPTSPALTINVQSWTTPIVGLFMLVIGLLGGYYLRPLTLAQADTTTTNPPVVVTQPATIPTADQSAAQQSLMDSLIPKVRHFTGDPNAPVTIIEFADFQCPYCGRFSFKRNPRLTKHISKAEKSVWDIGISLSWEMNQLGRQKLPNARRTRINSGSITTNSTPVSRAKTRERSTKII